MDDSSFLLLYFQDLIDELKSELGGDMENLVVAMMLPSDVFYARELDKAMKVSLISFNCWITNFKKTGVLKADVQKL